MQDANLSHETASKKNENNNKERKLSVNGISFCHFVFSLYLVVVLLSKEKKIICKILSSYFTFLSFFF